MGWYSIDVVEDAFEKTRHALIEPFDFWKWLKLGIIIFLIGGGGGGPNFNSFANTPPSDLGPGFPGEDAALPQTDELPEILNQFLAEYLTLILVIITLVVLLILVFSYISNIMEFVLVDSLVTNEVSFWAYSRKYLRMGFNLFIIRMILGLAFLSLLIIGLLPLLLPLLKSPSSIGPGLILGGLFWFFMEIIILAIIFGIIGSFINLSIPLAMYQQTGIIVAFKKIVANFRADWKQIIVYWVVRFVLQIAVAIIVAIAVLILLLLILLVLAVIGGILYFILTAVGIAFGDLVFWILVIPLGLVAFVLLVLFFLMVSVPAPVFIKYHMLTFLQAWYPDAGIPFFTISGSTTDNQGIQETTR